MSKKILIIDDEADIRMFLKTLLQKQGYETVTASDGHEGFELAKKEHPDLVLLDLMMPNQTGTDFYRRLRKIADLKDTPIIIVSGLPGRHLALKDPVAVFEKPIDQDKFLKVVNETLG